MPTKEGSAAAARAGKSQTERDGWPASFFRRLDAAVGDMLQEYPHLSPRAALLAVLEDNRDLAENYRLAMRWLGGGADYFENQERAAAFSEHVAAMSPALRHFIQGGSR